MGTLTKMEQEPTKFAQGSRADYDAITDDSQLKEAAEQAERTGSEMPLVREQLRTKIQLQRLKSGKGELTVEFQEPRKYELTAEEKTKQERRKMRNREAAKNSRFRKKKQHSQLQRDNKALVARRTKLTSQVDTLRDLFESLQKGLKQARICNSAYHPQARRQFLAQTPPIAAPQTIVKARSFPVPQAFTAPQRFILNQNQAIPVMNVQAEETVVTSADFTASRPASAELEQNTEQNANLSQEDVDLFVASLSGNTHPSSTLSTSLASSSESPVYVLPQGHNSTSEPQHISFLQYLQDEEPAEHVSKMKGFQSPLARYSPYSKQGSSPGTSPFGLDSVRSSTDSVVTSPDDSQLNAQALFNAIQGLNRGQ